MNELFSCFLCCDGIEAQALRNTGDYGQFNAVTAEKATEQLIHAKQFLELAQRQIGDL